MTIALAVLFALVAGAALPIQAGVNAQLSHWLDSSVRARSSPLPIAGIALVATGLLMIRLVLGDWAPRPSFLRERRAYREGIVSRGW